MLGAVLKNQIERSGHLRDHPFGVADDDAGAISKAGAREVFARLARSVRIDFERHQHDLEAANIEDVKNFFETYYAPNNAVLVVTGDATVDEVMRLAEKHFGAIPQRTLPPRPDISEPPQTAEKSSVEKDKLARTPAVAFGYHLPERMTKDFFALSLLDPLLVSDESAKMYQALVKENQIASNVQGGFNYGLGNNFDYNGPMLYTFRVDYRPDMTYLPDASMVTVVESLLSALAATSPALPIDVIRPRSTVISTGPYAGLALP